MANTDLILSIPYDRDGVALTGKSSAAWAFGPWVYLDNVRKDAAIYSVAFQPTFVMTADITYEFILEIGISNPEQTVLQIPYSMKNDTADGFYLNGEDVLLMEPFFVREGTRLSARLASHISGMTFTLDNFKLRVMSQYNIAIPDQSTENYKRFRVGNGMGSSASGWR
jgi:hypothetical protein